MQCASSTTSRPVASASRGSCSSRNRGLLSRSGLTSSRSTSSAASAAVTSAHSSALAELIVTARSPARRGGVDLVAHQRQQRRHDQRGAAAAGPQQGGRDEVDRRLAPAGALHDEHPLAALDQRLDRLELAVAELRASGRRPAGPAAPRLVGERRGDRGDGCCGGGGHGASPSQPPDTTGPRTRHDGCHDRGAGERCATGRADDEAALHAIDAPGWDSTSIFPSVLARVDGRAVLHRRPRPGRPPGGRAATASSPVTRGCAGRAPCPRTPT